MRRRVYCEDLPYDRLLASGVLGLLASRDIELVLAVRPKVLADLPGVVAAASKAGVRVALWPMLEDGDGRWASHLTARPFSAFVRTVLGVVPPREVHGLLLDLEPPMSLVRSMLDHPIHAAGGALPFPYTRRSAGGPAATGFAEGERVLSELVQLARSEGLSVTASVVPLVLADPTGSTWGYQRWLGTPVESLGLDGVTVMAYTSLFEGYSRQLIRRSDARALLAMCASRAVAHHGKRAALSLGAIHTGALGDERRYRGPAELADDVAIARAAGIEDLSLFDLRGALVRAPVEPWLDALISEEAPSRVASSLRASLVTAAVAVFRPVFGGVARLLG